jgi:hypothetical protein
MCMDVASCPGLKSSSILDNEAFRGENQKSAIVATDRQ